MSASTTRSAHDADFDQSPAAKEAVWLGHPVGLYGLFLTEMWERFCYYGLRAFFVFYLMKSLGMLEADARGLLGVYAGLTYFTPLLGGYLADSLLGQRKAIFIGGLLMASGMFALMSPQFLVIGLALVIVGNGFFKPNISTMVGTLYHPQDPRRDGAFTIFYIGINIGAFLAPLICGTLAERVAWHWGFFAAGVGMVLSTVVFQFSQGALKSGGLPPGRPVEKDKANFLKPRDYVDIVAIAAGVAILLQIGVWAWPTVRPWVWAPTWLLDPEKSQGLVWLYRLVVVGAAMAVFAMVNSAFASKGESHRMPAEPLTADDWKRIALIFIVVLFAAAFWMGFEQAAGTMNIFADEKVDRRFLNWFEIPASVFQAVNPMFIFLLGPLFSVLWTRLATSRYQISSIAKLSLGLIILGLGFGVLYQADSMADVSASHKVGFMWLVGVYFLHTVGELFLSPIGLSMVNRLSPARLVSLMMATWFLANAIANYLAHTLKEILTHYHVNLWVFLIVFPIGTGLLMLVSTPLLKKLAGGRD